MEVPVYLDETKCGVLSTEQKGLYTHFYAQLQVEALCRVYGVFSGGECALGVPAPEEGRMVLTAAMPTARLPRGRLLSGKIRLQGEGFQPFPGGKIAGVNYPPGQRKGNIFRFRWECGQPLPAEELFCFYQLVRESGISYLELRLREDGMPEV